MKRKKYLMIILLFSFAEIFYGCCGNNEYIRKETIVKREIPPAIFWNESEKTLQIFIIRGDGSRMINFFVEQNDFRIQPFSQEGDYRYYIKAYEIIESTDTRQFIGEIHGAFYIVIGKTKNYRNETAGIHIKITSKNIQYRKEASFDIFGDKNFVGIAKHKKHSEEITLRNSGSEANVKFTGGFALIMKLLKNK